MGRMMRSQQGTIWAQAEIYLADRAFWQDTVRGTHRAQTIFGTEPVGWAYSGRTQTRHNVSQDAGWG